MSITQISGSSAAIGAIVAVILFSLPAYIGTIKQTGLFRGLAIIFSLSIFALAFQTAATKTGLPFGRFNYGDGLGYKFIGTTPWVVAIIYPPILLGAFWLARKISSGFLSVIFTVIFAVIVDVALDPAMVKLTFWQWDAPGPFFGVPIMNFVGWAISGFIGALILKALWGEPKVKRLTAYSLFAILVFWSGVNLGVAQWIPAFTGLAFSTLLFVMFIIERRRQLSENE
jgi:putative membrane protein